MIIPITRKRSYLGINTTHKDRLFKFIFGNPEHKEWTLSLYNALNNSHYTNPDDIILNTIEDAVYLGMKNDVSFIVLTAFVLYIWEHQSSFNPNIPIRILIYAAQLYDKYLSDNNIYRYGSKLHMLPKPKCVCFYNGLADEPEERILKLSDAFGGEEGDIEVKVRMLNINYGRNRELMEACRPLKDYAWFIDAVRGHQKAGLSLEEAVDSAVEDMPESSLLKKFLLSNKAEVKGMYLTEYNAEKERSRAIAEGWEEGRAEGRAEGIHENMTRVASDMLKRSYPLEAIMEISRLSEAAIFSLAKSLGLSVNR